MATFSERWVYRWLERMAFQRQNVRTSHGRVSALIHEDHAVAAPPIMLIHGFGSSGAQLGGLARQLIGHSAKMTLIDLPGHGLSEVDGDLNSEVMRVDTLEAMDALLDRPTVLFGNSMGGMVALRYAAHVPDKVAGIILISPGGAPMDEATLASFKQLFHLDSHQESLRFVDGLFGQAHWARHAVALFARARINDASLQELMDSVAVDDLLSPDELHAIQCPTLFVWGDKDGVLPPAQREFFIEHLPETSEKLFPPDWGHSPYFGFTEELADMVIRFLEKLERRGLARIA